MTTGLYGRIKLGLRRLNIMHLAVVFLLVSLDLIVKSSLDARLEVWRGSVSVFPGFNLTLGHNRGVSFGALESAHWLSPYLLSSLAVILVVAVLIWTAPHRSKLVKIAGVLMASGGLANAIDRLGDGAVTDYLDFGWQALRWPTFNLADVFIFLGVALLFLSWRKQSLSQT